MAMLGISWSLGQWLRGPPIMGILALLLCVLWTGPAQAQLVGAFSETICVTSAGAAPGKPCIFPFEFNGAIHYKCTWDQSQLTDNKPWCSTLVDSTGHHVGGQSKWGNCGSGCPIAPRAGEKEEAPVTDSIPSEGSSGRERCTSEQFECGEAGKCIPKRWVCDYHWDCDGGEDEYDCPPPECDSGEFSCSNYKFNQTSCIQQHFQCDKEQDCHDGSDEQSCSRRGRQNVVCQS